MNTGVEITAQRASEFEIEGQGKDESDSAFRERVSGAIREKGNFIEAHEAFQNALYDQDEDAMTGIIGAVSQAMRGRDYSPNDGVSQVGDDIAVGTLEQDDRPKMSAEEALLMIQLFG